MSKIFDLKVNRLVNPINVDNKNPIFSWKFESNQFNFKQKKYNIIVKNQKNDVVWDSNIQEKSISSGIIFGDTGNVKEELKPISDYSWKITTWDNMDNVLESEVNFFSTAFISNSIDQWSNAKWIGSNKIYLDSKSLVVYRIKFDLKLINDSRTAAIIFGANDYRLNNDIFNEYRIKGENYIKIELDGNELDKKGICKINIYRVGYALEDSSNSPFITISKDNYSNCNLDDIINYKNFYENHYFEIVCDSSTIKIFIDRKALRMGDTKNQTGQSVANEFIQLNPRGIDDVQSFPLVNNIGFYMKKNQDAVISDYKLTTYREPEEVLFDASIGASYDIFNKSENIKVDKNKICISGKEKGFLFYNNPSYGALPMLRKEFTIDNEFISSKLYITSRGIFDLYINGDHVNNEYFNPGLTEYEKTINYICYDIKKYIKKGENVIGIILAPGWWSGMVSFMETNTSYYGYKTSCLLDIIIKFNNGDVQNIVSNTDDWKAFNNGPIRFADIFQGETYDATYEKSVENWSKTSFDDTNWEEVVEDFPMKRFANPDLLAKQDNGVCVYEKRKSTYIGESRENSGSYIYDMGVNMVGVPEINIKANSGDLIILRTAEVLYPNINEYKEADVDGLMMVENLREALSTDFYICSDGEQTIRPRFTYHGYRYLEISGIKKPLPELSVSGIVLSSIGKMTGSFKTSNKLINQLQENIQRSQLGNFLSIPTDCPQRNERMGWTESVVEFARTSYLNSSDVYNFYLNFYDILKDSQIDEIKIKSNYNFPDFYNNTLFSDKIAGLFPSYAPSYNAVKSWGTAWSSAPLIVAWELYEYFGDMKIISENYNLFKKYINAMKSLIIDDCEYLAADGGQCGDWLSLDKPPVNYTDSTIYVYCLHCMIEMSGLLGEIGDVKEYRHLYMESKKEWNNRFVDKENAELKDDSSLVNQSESSYTIALYYNVVEDKFKESFAKKLVEQVEKGYNNKPYSITTGLYTTPMVNLVLSEYGHSDIAYKMIQNIEYPSWLYSVTQKATSMWERWNSFTEKDGFGGNNNMNSFNHFSLGGVGAWLYNYVLGIRKPIGKSGMQNFILNPMFNKDLQSAKGQVETDFGIVNSEWQYIDDFLIYKFTVPANTSAKIILEIKNIKEIEVNPDFINNLLQGNGKVTFNVDSGKYVCKVIKNILTIKNM